MAAVIQLDTRDEDLLISRGSEDVVLRWVDLEDGADRYWDGGTSTDLNDINNWSDTDGGATPATSVPGTGDHAHFTANGDGNACTLTSDWAVGETTVLVGYTSKIDLAGYNLATNDGGDITGDGAGEIDWGEGTIELTNGTFDVADQTTNTCGTSELICYGTCLIYGCASAAKGMYSLKIDADASVTISSTSYFKGTQTIGGELAVANSVSCVCSNGDMAFTGSGTLTGDGNLVVQNTSTGAVTVTDASIDIDGNLTIDNDSTGTITIAGFIALGGDVVDEITGEGAVDLTGLYLRINGSANQSIDLHDLTLSSLVVASMGGTVTMADGWTAGSFNQTSGTIDWNGETFVTTGNFRMKKTSAGADTFNDVSITVGGDFQAISSDMRAESGHSSVISVTGSASASSVNVAYSDASGGTGIVAYNSTNGGNNTSWTFVDLSNSAGLALSGGLKVGI